MSDQQSSTPVDLHKLTAHLGTLAPIATGKSGNGTYAMATLKHAKGTAYTHVMVESAVGSQLVMRALTAALTVLAGGGR